MLVRVKAKSSRTTRNQNKSSHIHLPCPRLAAAGDMVSTGVTGCVAPIELLTATSAIAWNMPPNPPLSVVPKGWQDTMRGGDTPGTMRSKEGLDIGRVGVTVPVPSQLAGAWAAAPSARRVWEDGGSWDSGATLRGCGEKPLPCSHPPPFPPIHSLPATSPGTCRQDLSLGGNCWVVRMGFVCCHGSCQAQLGRTCVLGQLLLQAVTKTSL